MTHILEEYIKETEQDCLDSMDVPKQHTRRIVIATMSWFFVQMHDSMGSPEQFEQFMEGVKNELSTIGLAALFKLAADEKESQFMADQAVNNARKKH